MLPAVIKIASLNLLPFIKYIFINISVYDERASRIVAPIRIQIQWTQ